MSRMMRAERETKPYSRRVRACWTWGLWQKPEINSAGGQRDFSRRRWVYRARAKVRYQLRRMAGGRISQGRMGGIFMVGIVRLFCVNLGRPLQ